MKPKHRRVVLAFFALTAPHLTWAAGSNLTQEDALWKAIQAASPEVTDNTSWYAVRTDTSSPCQPVLKGRRPEAAFAAVPGIALIKADQTKLPDLGATLLTISINNNGKVERLEFTNLNGACMALTEMQRRKDAAQARDEAKLGRPVTWSAQLPASRVLMSFDTPCSVEEVVIRHPEAHGGREVRPNGDYLESCWWDAGDSVMVHTPFGSNRAISKSAITVQRRR